LISEIIKEDWNR